MTGVSIVPLPEARVGEAADLVITAFKSDWRNVGAVRKRIRGEGRENFHALAALSGDRIVGVLTMGRKSADSYQGLPLCRMYNVAVDPAREREGIGAALVLRAEEIASVECLGGKPGFMYVDDATRQSCEEKGFYQSLGYVSPNRDVEKYKPLSQPQAGGRQTCLAVK